MAGRRPALQQNWKSSEKSQHFKEKTQYLMNTLYITVTENLKSCVSLFVVCCCFEGKLFAKKKATTTTGGMCALLVFNMLKFACLLSPKTTNITVTTI